MDDSLFLLVPGLWSINTGCYVICWGPIRSSIRMLTFSHPSIVIYRYRTHLIDVYSFSCKISVLLRSDLLWTSDPQVPSRTVLRARNGRSYEWWLSS